MKTPESLALLFQRLDLPNPTLDPCAGSGELLAALGPRAVRARGIEMERSKAKTAKRAGLRVEQGIGLREGWGDEHVIVCPPDAGLFEWLHKGVNEALTMVARVPVEALVEQGEFWTRHPPRALAFDGEAVWVFWSKDPKTKAPGGMVSVVWL